MSFAHEELWSSIPTRHDHVCHEDIVMAAVEHVLRDSSSETKVGDLKQTLVVQKDIGRLQVSVDDIILVVVFRYE